MELSHGCACACVTCTSGPEQTLILNSSINGTSSPETLREAHAVARGSRRRTWDSNLSLSAQRRHVVCLRTHSSAGPGWNPKLLEFPRCYFPAAHRDSAQTGRTAGSASQGPSLSPLMLSLLLCPSRVSCDVRESAPGKQHGRETEKPGTGDVGWAPAHQRMLLPVWGRCHQPVSGTSQVGAEKADLVAGRACAPHSWDVTSLFRTTSTA